jgi:type I restriction enzyme S subunit
MSSEWRRLRIGDVGRVVTGKTPSTANAENFGGPYPFITIPDLSQGREVRKAERSISETGASALRSCLLPTNAVLMSCIATIGKTGIATRPSFTNQQINSVICGADVLPKYLYYVFSQLGKELEAAGGGGSVYTNVSKSRFSDIEIPVPTICEQSAISQLLGVLDDRITLLREANVTLEAIAQALFKSWFVDFDPVRAKMEGRAPEGMDEATAALFPDSLEETALGVVPRGWRVGTVANLGEVICGKTPPTSNPENYGDEVPFITIPDMHGFLVVTATNRSLSRTGADGQKKKYLPPGTVCVSCIATPGLVIRVTTESQTNQQINSVVPFSSWGKSFPLFLLRRIGDAVRAGGSGGSVFHNLSKSGFEELKVLLTSSEVAHMFDEFVEPLTARIESNQRQAQTLSTLRDTLLPRLISGQLSLDIAAGAKVEHHA